MKFIRMLQRGAVALSCVGMLTAQFAQAANGTAVHRRVEIRTEIQDVALQAGGRLRGQISDVQGAPQAAVQVAVIKAGTPVAVVATDTAGQFEIRDLSAGIYEIRTAHTAAVYRVWSPGTAPPAAQQGVLMVAGPQVVRGSNVGAIFGNPYVLGLIVAAAIAIPLALDSDDDAS